MSTAYEKLMSTDSHDSQHKLRVAILRAIKSPHPGKPDQLSNGTLLPVHKAYCESIAAGFLEDFKMLLKTSTNSEQNTRDEELVTILEEATQLSIILAVEHPYLAFWFLSDADKTSFSMDNPEFKPHRALKLDDTEKDQEHIACPSKLLYRPYDLVVEPCVTRHGNKDAEQYDKRKVVHRGIVWMIKEKCLVKVDLKSKGIKRESPSDRTEYKAKEQHGIDGEPPSKKVVSHPKAFQFTTFQTAEY
jgi:hypothetical protein